GALSAYISKNDKSPNRLNRHGRRSARVILTLRSAQRMKKQCVQRVSRLIGATLRQVPSNSIGASSTFLLNGRRQSVHRCVIWNFTQRSASAAPPAACRCAAARRGRTVELRRRGTCPRRTSPDRRTSSPARK